MACDLGPDHLQLTLLNWDIKSVLALNEKTKSELEISVFYLMPKHFQFRNIFSYSVPYPTFFFRTRFGIIIKNHSLILIFFFRFRLVEFFTTNVPFQSQNIINGCSRTIPSQKNGKFLCWN